MTTATAALVLLALTLPIAGAGCGDAGQVEEGAEADASPPPDAAIGADAGACSAWQLVRSSAAIESITVDPGPHNTEKTLRAFVHTALAPCERQAIPAVTLSEETAAVLIRLMVWRQVEGTCADAGTSVVRAVPLRLGRPATWTIAAGDQSIEVAIESAPSRPCRAAGGPCEMDCDCEGEGLRCLTGSGLVGPFTECARPCELDRDCDGHGICLHVLDGVAAACTGDVECTDEVGCADGWRCAAGTCEPDFTLSTATRSECGCDADCHAPLRCVRPAQGPRGRCELPCESEGPWCEGPHACGPAATDLAGLAETDSVCVFQGE